MSAIPTYRLSNGITMPSVGLGTYRIRDPALLDACLLAALRSGYRLIDTAIAYRNEAAIGASLRRILDQNLVPGLTRQDIFLTTKLAPKDQGYEACHRAVLESLQNLQVDYIDLYLIHWPGTAKLRLPDPQNKVNRMESWRALEELYHAKKLRAIGVSNYSLTHLTQLLERPHLMHNNNSNHDTASPMGSSTATTPASSSELPAGVLTTTPTIPPQHHHHHARTMVMPHVHQFELHPRLLQRDLLDFCNHHRIQVQAYSSLGEGRLISLTGPSLPPMEDAFNNTTPVVHTLDIMPDLIRKYFGDATLLPPPSLPMPRSQSPAISRLTATAAFGGNDERLGSLKLVEDDATRLRTYSTRAAQILLRWGLQHGAVVIPKSAHPDRIQDNRDLFGFEIDAADMAALDAYSMPGERTRYCWDPTDVV